MATYMSLKDYLSLNYKDDISQGIKEKLKSDKGIDVECKVDKLFTLNCKPFEKIIDVYDNANLLQEYTVGLSAEVMKSDEKKQTLHYYSILLKSIVLGQQIIFMVGSINEVESEEDFQEETIPSLFGLPDIPYEMLEEEAEKIYAELCSNIEKNHNRKYMFPVIDIKNKLGMKMWPADLPDDCMGRLYFWESKETIYAPQNVNKPYVDVLC